MKKTIIGLIIIISIIMFSWTIFQNQNREKNSAVEFLELYYTVEDTPIYSVTNISVLEKSLNNKYGNLVTQTCLENLTANRLIIENEQFVKELGGTLSLKSVQLEKDTGNNADISQYTFKVTAILTFEDNTTKEIELMGTISVIKENENYKVNYFKPSKRLMELKI